MKLPRCRIERAMMLAVLLLPTSAVRADLITSLTVDVQSQAGGLTFYQYRLTNASASDLGVFQFTLSVATSANLTALTGPTGWDIIYSPGDSEIVWASSGSTTDLAPGTSALFSLTSPLGPSSRNYLIAGINESIPLLQTNTGQIAAPGASAVPEPSSLVLAAVGIAGALAIRRWRG